MYSCTEEVRLQSITWYQPGFKFSYVSFEPGYGYQAPAPGKISVVSLFMICYPTFARYIVFRHVACTCTTSEFINQLLVNVGKAQSVG